MALKFDNMVNDFEMWKRGIGAILSKYAEVEQATVTRIENAYEKAIKRGKLRMRPLSGGESWDEFYFVLTETEVLVMEKNSGGQMEVFDMYEIQPSCSVFETNLGPFAFELVTSEKVLHVMSDSRDATTAWIQAIRGSISGSKPKTDDPLLQAALAKLEEDIFYDVSFHEDKPLGVVLERSGEWAIVKLSNSRDTGVSIGSALTSINGESCILQPYAATIDKLKNWRPPLHLGFRRAPKKSGFLVKLSRQRRGSNSKNWKRRFFVLEEGRLVYKDADASDSPIKGDVPLMGSAVSLVSSSETGKFFCFRVVSGVTSLTVQGETLDEMMDWASLLYHAIAIANGGAHILGIERQRVEEEEARLRAKAAVAAEKARLEREKAEAEAREQAEREARAKAAAEEALRREALAEEEKLRLEAEDVKRKVIEDASSLLRSAMASRDISVLSDAISKVNECAHVSEVRLISDASSLLALLTEREIARLKSFSALEAITGTATMDHVPQLSAAIDDATENNVDEELIEKAKSRLRVLKQMKAKVDEVRSLLAHACHTRTASALENALNVAGSIAYSGEDLTDANALLLQLMEEEAQRRKEEEERLAAEAAQLELEMAREREVQLAEASSSSVQESFAHADDDEDDDCEIEGTKAPEPEEVGQERDSDDDEEEAVGGKSDVCGGGGHLYVILCRFLMLYSIL